MDATAGRCDEIPAIRYQVAEPFDRNNLGTAEDWAVVSDIIDYVMLDVDKSALKDDYSGLYSILSDIRGVSNGTTLYQEMFCRSTEAFEAKVVARSRGQVDNISPVVRDRLIAALRKVQESKPCKQFLEPKRLLQEQLATLLKNVPEGRLKTLQSFQNSWALYYENFEITRLRNVFFDYKELLPQLEKMAKAKELGEHSDLLLQMVKSWGEGHSVLSDANRMRLAEQSYSDVSQISSGNPHPEIIAALATIRKTLDGFVGVDSQRLEARDSELCVPGFVIVNFVEPRMSEFSASEIRRGLYLKSYLTDFLGCKDKP